MILDIEKMKWVKFAFLGLAVASSLAFLKPVIASVRFSLPSENYSRSALKPVSGARLNYTNRNSTRRTESLWLFGALTEGHRPTTSETTGKVTNV